MRRLLAVIAATAILVGGATGVWVAQAAIPSASDVFTGCVTKTTGAIRLIDAERTPPVNCKSSEFRVTWNEHGQDGKDAFDFVRYEGTRRTTTNNIVGDARVYSSTVLCDEGDKLLFGDSIFAQDPAFPNQVKQEGLTDLGTDGWSALVRVHPDARVDNAIFAQAEAFCADSAAPFDHTD